MGEKKETASSENTVIVPAYAKINLFLDITGTLPNGYHSLNNIMQQVDLHDNVTVTFEEKGETDIEITCGEPQIPCDERNIAYRAARLFLTRASLSGRVSVDIEKNIPVMAGLGGSSTDGAAVLEALNKLCGSPFTKKQLEEMGAGLGADVPFCIRGGCAHCKGIGEKMTDIRGLERCSILIIQPSFSSNTAAAYGRYDKAPVRAAGEPEKLLTALEKGDLSGAASNLYNIFEKLDGTEKIEKIKKEILERGALGAALSGSGSAVYGIFTEEFSAFDAALNLNYPVRIVTNPLSALANSEKIC